MDFSPRRRKLAAGGAPLVRHSGRGESPAANFRFVSCGFLGRVYLVRFKTWNEKIAFPLRNRASRAFSSLQPDFSLNSTEAEAEADANRRDSSLIPTTLFNELRRNK